MAKSAISRIGIDAVKELDADSRKLLSYAAFGIGLLISGYLLTKGRRFIIVI